MKSRSSRTTRIGMALFVAGLILLKAASPGGLWSLGPVATEGRLLGGAIPTGR